MRILNESYFMQLFHFDTGLTCFQIFDKTRKPVIMYIHLINVSFNVCFIKTNS